MVIRRMVETDLDMVMAIWLSGNLEAHAFVDPAYWRSNEKPVREAISNAEVYVAESSGQILGFIGLTGNYIAGLFVSAPYRNRGIGKALLAFAERMHPENLTLEVYEKNRNAVRFYKREGFRVQKKQNDPEAGEEEYRMVLS